MPQAYAREIARMRHPGVERDEREHERERTLHPARRYVASQLRALAHSIEQSAVRHEDITPTERASALTILSEVMGHVTRGRG